MWAKPVWQFTVCLLKTHIIYLIWGLRAVRIKGRCKIYMGYVKKAGNSGIGPHLLLKSFGEQIYMCFGWLSSLSYRRAGASMENNQTTMAKKQQFSSSEMWKENDVYVCKHDSSTTSSVLDMPECLSPVIQNPQILLIYLFLFFKETKNSAFTEVKKNLPMFIKQNELVCALKLQNVQIYIIAPTS